MDLFLDGLILFAQLPELRAQLVRLAVRPHRGQIAVLADQRVHDQNEGNGGDRVADHPAAPLTRLEGRPESLARTGDQKVTILSFSDENGTRVENKIEKTPLAWFKGFLEALGPFISFGEQFGSLHATGTEDATVVDPNRVKELREKAGFAAAEGGNR